jgi:hypothetical protein
MTMTDHAIRTTNWYPCRATGHKVCCQADGGARGIIEAVPIKARTPRTGSARTSSQTRGWVPVHQMMDVHRCRQGLDCHDLTLSPKAPRQAIFATALSRSDTKPLPYAHAIELYGYSALAGIAFMDNAKQTQTYISLCKPSFSLLFDLRYHTSFASNPNWRRLCLASLLRRCP